MSHRDLQPWQPKTDGPWTAREATHLLWRAGFGASPADIDRTLKEGLNQTLDRLISPDAESPKFDDTQQLLRGIAIDTQSVGDLKAWWLYRMQHVDSPLTEKMTLLWHNHFATSYGKVQSVNHMLAQNDLMRQHALGDFRELLHGMARDVAMLIWLDGNANRKRHPNENFAREVMELFSLGEGNYSEQDIAEAARAFTGWHVRRKEFWFNRIQHDTGVKNVLGRRGNFDGNDIIDICLDQEACPRFLAWKLLRTFVVDRPDEAHLSALAERITHHKYQMQPVLRELLGSRLFFSASVRGSLIKSPIELVIGSYRTLGCAANLSNTIGVLADLGQDVFEPPSVKGWEGGRQWISSTTLLKRTDFATELIRGDKLGLIDTMPAALTTVASDSRSLVDDAVELLLSRDLNPTAFDSLTAFLQGGSESSADRVRGVAHLILTLPEYQLT